MFTFLTHPSAPDGSPDEARLDGRYEQATDTWTVIENPCGLDTSAAVWDGSLILDVSTRLAYDPASGRCATIPDPPRKARSRPLRVWTGTELALSSCPGAWATWRIRERVPPTTASVRSPPSHEAGAATQ